MQEIERTWTFTHQFPGEESRTWLLHEPTIDGVELPYMRHLEAQQKAGLSRNFDTREPGYKIALEVFLQGFNNGAYRWGSDNPTFRATFRDPENEKVVLYHWFREAEEKAGVPAKDRTTRDLVNRLWKARWVDLDKLLAEMLTDPLASSPQTGGELMTGKSAPSSQTDTDTAENRSAG